MVFRRSLAPSPPSPPASDPGSPRAALSVRPRSSTRASPPFASAWLAAAALSLGSASGCESPAAPAPSSTTERAAEAESGRDRESSAPSAPGADDPNADREPRLVLDLEGNLAFRLVDAAGPDGTPGRWVVDATGRGIARIAADERGVEVLAVDGPGSLARLRAVAGGAEVVDGSGVPSLVVRRSGRTLDLLAASGALLGSIDGNGALTVAGSPTQARVRVVGSDLRCAPQVLSLAELAFFERVATWVWLEGQLG